MAMTSLVTGSSVCRAQPLPADGRAAQATAIGVTRGGHAIPALLAPDAHDYYTRSVRVLLVEAAGGDASIQMVLHQFVNHHARKPRAAAGLSFSAVTNMRPGRGGIADPPGAAPFWTFPPAKNAYNEIAAPETQYLWRWLGIHAPDLVVVVRRSRQTAWATTAGVEQLPFYKSLAGARRNLEDSDSLAKALATSRPTAVDTIPTVVLDVTGDPRRAVPPLLAALARALAADPPGLSKARMEIQRRLARSPRQLAESLSEYYGHALPQVAYIPAIALIGRLRLGEFAGTSQQREDVIRILQPYAAGTKATQPRSGSALSGHLVFCEMAESAPSAEEKVSYIALARHAADLCFKDGELPPSLDGFLMPFHSEMSDAVFMGGPVLARTGALLKDPRYYDACYAHLASLRRMLVRRDGLYRHSPLDQAAWGRGNGFAAMGQAMCLSYLPSSGERYDELLSAYRNHIRSLVARQSASGCWHQVVDRHESYRELSCTCMISFAIIRGIRRGWLKPEEYSTSVQRAWQAIRTRVAWDGTLVDVCTGTGKQKSLRAYYDRPAILGKDDRGGAMALLVATELALWQSEHK